MSIEDVILDP